MAKPSEQSKPYQSIFGDTAMLQDQQARQQDSVLREALRHSLGSHIKLDISGNPVMGDQNPFSNGFFLNAGDRAAKIQDRQNAMQLDRGFQLPQAPAPPPAEAAAKTPGPFDIPMAGAQNPMPFQLPQVQPDIQVGPLSFKMPTSSDVGSSYSQPTPMQTQPQPEAPRPTADMLMRNSLPKMDRPVDPLAALRQQSQAEQAGNRSIWPAVGQAAVDYGLQPIAQGIDAAGGALFGREETPEQLGLRLALERAGPGATPEMVQQMAQQITRDEIIRRGQQHIGPGYALPKAPAPRQYIPMPGTSTEAMLHNIANEYGTK